MIRKRFIITNHYAGIYEDAEAHWVDLRVEKVDADGWHVCAAGDDFAIYCFLRFLKTK